MMRLASFCRTWGGCWKTEMNERRLKRVLITPELLVEICKTHDNPMRWLHTCDGLPEDAVFERACIHDTMGGVCTIMLIVRSRAFENLSWMQEIPEISVSFTKVDGDSGSSG